MKVGDQIVLSPAAVRAYNLSSDIGLVVGRVPNDATPYPLDYHVLIDGDVIHMGFAIAEPNNSEVVSGSK
ncbi:MAG: hypothetical protein H8E12_08985 [Rhodobacteraceae bacterium]|nr:hypothetical protein [Paracoccaceae bacterium]